MDGRPGLLFLISGGKWTFDGLKFPENESISPTQSSASSLCGCCVVRHVYTACVQLCKYAIAGGAREQAHNKRTAEETVQTAEDTGKSRLLLKITKPTPAPVSLPALPPPGTGGGVAVESSIQALHLFGVAVVSVPCNTIIRLFIDELIKKTESPKM